MFSICISSLIPAHISSTLEGSEFIFMHDAGDTMMSGDIKPGAQRNQRYIKCFRFDQKKFHAKRLDVRQRLHGGHIINTSYSGG